jgi:hypothetical protein
VQQAESQADRELRIKRHDGRGLIVTAVDAWALAINIRCQHDKSICAGACIGTRYCTSAVTPLQLLCLTHDQCVTTTYEGSRLYMYG